MNPAPPVALIEDDSDLRASIAQMLRIEGHVVLEFDGAEPALAAIGREFEGPVVTDVRMPGMSGIDLFHRLIERDDELPVILMTGHGDVEMAVNALRVGAWDFLTKPFDQAMLTAAVARAASHRQLVMQNRALRAGFQQGLDRSPLIGRSPAITRLRETAAILAQSDLDILVEGESGVGKELFARVVHAEGRRTGPFVAVACGAAGWSVSNSDLFSTNGRIAQVGNGTLFLDDIDLASPELQARMAEFVETRRVGSGMAAMTVACRIIASIGEGEHGATGPVAPTLFFRLAGMRLRIPPLRERSEDVPLLFAHFVDEAARRLQRPVPPIDAAARDMLVGNAWPGNVRQLANFADQFVLGLVGDAGTEAGRPLPERVAAFEREAIVDAVLAARGDVATAIATLGLPRKTFYYKVARHGINLAELRRKSG